MQVSASLLNHLEQQTGQDLSKHRLTRVGGGDINSAFQIKTQQINWFIKLNQASLSGLFIIGVYRARPATRQKCRQIW
jgi:protein-ribulosamine 3-kinase